MCIGSERERELCVCKDEKERTQIKKERKKSEEE